MIGSNFYVVHVNFFSYTVVKIHSPVSADAKFSVTQKQFETELLH